MSAFGTKQTPQTAEPMSAFGRKADIGQMQIAANIAKLPELLRK